MLSTMPREVFEGFVKEYTEKQWGCAARQLDAALARRVEIRWDDDPRLTPNARYQGLPVDGYSALIERMLHTIPVLLNVDYLKNRELFRPRRMTVFTGAIDEYFAFTFGRLHYRAQQRRTWYDPDAERVQPVAQVNEPQHVSGPHIRTIEWKHLMRRRDTAQVRGTVLTRETPYSPTDPDAYEYPFPDEANRSLYDRYRALASTVPETLICGRLGEYRYYDMDQAIGRAMMLAQTILNSAGQSAPAETRSPAGRSIATAAQPPGCRSA
jgi:UDP-galactopyranose mutase